MQLKFLFSSDTSGRSPFLRYVFCQVCGNQVDLNAFPCYSLSLLEKAFWESFFLKYKAYIIRTGSLSDIIKIGVCFSFSVCPLGLPVLHDLSIGFQFITFLAVSVFRKQVGPPDCLLGGLCKIRSRQRLIDSGKPVLSLLPRKILDASFSENNHPSFFRESDLLHAFLSEVPPSCCCNV